MSDTRQHADFDVVIAGGGLAGLSLARQLRLRVAASCASSSPRSAAHSGAGGGVQGRRVDGRDRGALLPHPPRLAAHLRERQLEKFGLRYFYPSPRQPRASKIASSSGRPCFPPVRRSSSIAAGSRTSWCDGARSAGVEVDRCRAGHRRRSRRSRTCRRCDRGQASRRDGRWLVDATGRHGLLRRQAGL